MLFIKSKKENIFISQVSKNNALKFAAENGQLDVVKLLIEHKANNLENAYNMAQYNNYIDIMKYIQSIYDKV